MGGVKSIRGVPESQRKYLRRKRLNIVLFGRSQKDKTSVLDYVQLLLPFRLLCFLPPVRSVAVKLAVRFKSL